VTPEQRAAVHGHLDRFARESRGVGLSDQELAEFMLDLSVRWLRAHGVSGANIHAWINSLLTRRSPLPLTAAARSSSDFGARR
jgi:hypothetical protein